MKMKDMKLEAVMAADAELMRVLEAWRLDDAHVGNVTLALHTFIAAVVTHAITPKPSKVVS
jgi:hypothetical protein